jgi:hypothetical protein
MGFKVQNWKHMGNISVLLKSQVYLCHWEYSLHISKGAADKDEEGSPGNVGNHWND